MRSTLLLPLIFLLPALPLAHASGGDCVPWNTPALGEIEIGDGTAAHTFYVDDRNYALGNGIWIYQESNGIFTPHAPVTVTTDPTVPSVPYWWVWLAQTASVQTGNAPQDLQRGGSSNIVPNDNDICVDDPTVAPDQLIF